MSIEMRNAVASKLLEHRQEILPARDLLMTIADAKEEDKRRVLLNYHYLTTTGGLTPQQYRDLFQRCVQQNDFTDLAIITRTHCKEQYEALLNQQDLPARERAGLVNGIAIQKGALTALSERKREEGKSDLSSLGRTALEETPDWFLDIEQSGMTLEQVYEFLEQPSGASPFADPDVVKGVGDTKRSIRSVVPPTAP